MTGSTNQFLDEILQANQDFKNRIDPKQLPVAGSPGNRLIITCMDPRVSLDAIGIPQFASIGATKSSIRIVRTIGAMSEPRSLIIALYLAGIREITVVMHTDCGCCLAWSKIDTIIENLRQNLSSESFQSFAAEIGQPFKEKLLSFLKAFADPRPALIKGMRQIKESVFAPKDLIVHGLLYELATSKIEALKTLPGKIDTEI